MPSEVTTGTGSGAHRSRWSWLLPAGTFLAGCALGGVVVGVGAAGGDDGPTTQAASTAADAEPGRQDGAAAGDEPSGAADPGLYVRVPDSCLRTADDATTLVEHVDRVVEAVAELQPERLRQTVDDVQQIRDEVQDVAQQCRAAAAQRLQGAEASDDDAPATPAS